MAFGSRFRGGVHPRAEKVTASAVTTAVPRPEKVTLALRQHIGAPCQPLVKVGDHVCKGQIIGDVDAVVSAPVHASVSGKVKAVESQLHPGGRLEPMVVIEADPEDEWWSELPEPMGWDLDPESLAPAMIQERVRWAGIVGLGGAGFPTSVKLTPRPDGPAPDVVILNGAECEPALTADHRLMVEEPARVVLGLRLAMQAVGAQKGIIAVEANKPDAVAALKPYVAADPRLKLEVLPVRYPQGAEKMLVWAVLGRAVPVGAIPLNVGVVVQNVATAAAVAEALAEGHPLVERIVTVTGRVNNPGNFLAPLGISFEELVVAAGGASGPVVKAIAGGPMMGAALPNLSVPITKVNGGLLLLGPEDLDNEPVSPCIRCGRCVAACPMSLLPSELAHAAETGDWDRADRLHAMACIECGSCSYSCPAHRPLVQAIRLAKAQLGRRARKAGAK